MKNDSSIKNESLYKMKNDSYSKNESYMKNESSYDYIMDSSYFESKIDNSKNNETGYMKNDSHSKNENNSLKNDSSYISSSKNEYNGYIMNNDSSYISKNDSYEKNESSSMKNDSSSMKNDSSFLMVKNDNSGSLPPLSQTQQADIELPSLYKEFKLNRSGIVYTKRGDTIVQDDEDESLKGDKKALNALSPDTISYRRERYRLSRDDLHPRTNAGVRKIPLDKKLPPPQPPPPPEPDPEVKTTTIHRSVSLDDVTAPPINSSLQNNPALPSTMLKSALKSPRAMEPSPPQLTQPPAPVVKREYKFTLSPEDEARVELLEQQPKSERKLVRQNTKPLLREDERERVQQHAANILKREMMNYPPDNSIIRKSPSDPSIFEKNQIHSEVSSTAGSGGNKAKSRRKSANQSRQRFSLQLILNPNDKSSSKLKTFPQEKEPSVNHHSEKKFGLLRHSLWLNSPRHHHTHAPGIKPNAELVSSSPFHHNPPNKPPKTPTDPQIHLPIPSSANLVDPLPKSSRKNHIPSRSSVTDQIPPIELTDNLKPRRINQSNNPALSGSGFGGGALLKTSSPSKNNQRVSISAIPPTVIMDQRNTEGPLSAPVTPRFHGHGIKFEDENPKESAPLGVENQGLDFGISIQQILDKISNEELENYNPNTSQHQSHSSQIPRKKDNVIKSGNKPLRNRMTAPRPRIQRINEEENQSNHQSNNQSNHQKIPKKTLQRSISDSSLDNSKDTTTKESHSHKARRQSHNHHHKKKSFLVNLAQLTSEKKPPPPPPPETTTTKERKISKSSKILRRPSPRLSHTKKTEPNEDEETIADSSRPPLLLSLSHLFQIPPSTVVRSGQTQPLPSSPPPQNSPPESPRAGGGGGEKEKPQQKRKRKSSTFYFPKLSPRKDSL